MSLFWTDKIGDVRLATDRTSENSVSLTEKVLRALRELITSGQVLPGDKLPTEPALIEQFGVSRTVIREAIAALRAEKFVESRHGSGVFVLEFSRDPISSLSSSSLSSGAIKKISEVLEELELRAAVEMEAAVLASQRGSPAQLAAIMEKSEEFEQLALRDAVTTEADFEFHLAIAKATNNPRFEKFLRALGRHTIPREHLRNVLKGKKALPSRDKSLSEEHRAIAEAIAARNPAAARDAMRAHLDGSAERYRFLSR